MEIEKLDQTKIVIFNPLIAREENLDNIISPILTRMPLHGLVHIMPRTFTDERGSFKETFNYRDILAPICAFLSLDINMLNFCQDSHSDSHPGVVRGIHAENMYKIIRVINGSAICGFIDLRQDSPTFGQVVTMFLTPDLGEVFIPPGIGNSFMAITELEYVYKVTREFTKISAGERRAINPLDTTLNIPWLEIFHSFVSEGRLILSKERDLKDAVPFSTFNDRKIYGWPKSYRWS